MADVQFRNTRDRSDRLNVVIIEAVAGVHLQLEIEPLLHRLFDAHQLLPARLAGFRFRVAAGVNFDHRRTGFGGRLDLVRIGVHKKRHAYAGTGKFSADAGDLLKAADDIQSAFGRQFLTSFGYETNLVRMDTAGDGPGSWADPARQISTFVSPT